MKWQEISVPQRHTARAIVLHANKILLIERWRPGKHYFSVPGGGIEPGETPEMTVLRELLEETSCVAAIERKLYLMQTEDGSLNHVFLCSYISGEPQLAAQSPEADRGPNNRFEPRWLPVEDLAEVPFLVWEPIRRQLVHDLASSFNADIVTLP